MIYQVTKSSQEGEGYNKSVIELQFKCEETDIVLDCSPEYQQNNHGEHNMSSTPLIFRVLNPVMMGLLRSPLHSIASGQIMILSFTGRKSGRAYATPVSYYQENHRVTCFTHAAWWKNLGGGAEVKLVIRRQEHTGIGNAINDDREKMIDGLRKLLSAVPNDARFYDVSADENGELDQDDLARAIEQATMIEIQLEGTGGEKPAHEKA